MKFAYNKMKSIMYGIVLNFALLLTVLCISPKKFIRLIAFSKHQRVIGVITFVCNWLAYSFVFFFRFDVLFVPKKARKHWLRKSRRGRPWLEMGGVCAVPLHSCPSNLCLTASPFHITAKRHKWDYHHSCHASFNETW